MKQAHYTEARSTSKGIRLWLEGQKLVQAGFLTAAQYRIEYLQDKQVILITLDPEGSRAVTNTKRGGRSRPVIDLQNQQVSQMFKDGQRIKVTILQGQMIIERHHEDRAQLRREQQFMERVISGQLEEASMFTGGGVSTEAIHKALGSSGLDSRTSWVAEMEPKYIESAGQNCTAIDDDTVFLIGKVEEIERRFYTNVDILSFSMPCAGFSKAGKSKHKQSPIEHSGTVLFPVVAAIQESNPAVIISENVSEAQDSPMYSLLRAELIRLGYKIFEQVMDNTQTDAMENRKRYWLTAISDGLAPSKLELPKVAPSGKQLKDILQQVPESDWKAYAYLADKAKRDKAAGKGFARQLLDGSETKVGTIGRGYAKARSTEPFMTRTKDSKQRLLTPTEHAMVKCIPPYMVDGQSATTAHEILGQSVDYKQPFKLVKQIVAEVL